MSKTATTSGGMILTGGSFLAQASDVSGRPFRSSLRPHLEFIRSSRRADKSWQEIADSLRAQYGLEITGRGVGRFFEAAARRAARRAAWPLGMEPTPTTAAAPTEQPGGRFRSALFPHLVFIAAQRKDGQSWREIAEALGAKGLKISHEAVRDFFQRTQARAMRRAQETSLPPAAGPVRAEPIQAQPAPQAEPPAVRPPLPGPQPQEPSQEKPAGSPFYTKKTSQGRKPIPPPDPLEKLN